MEEAGGVYPIFLPAQAGEPAVIDALERNLWRLWSRFGRGPGCRLHDDEAATWFETPIPTLPYNGVVRFAASTDADRRVAAICEHYRGRGVPFLWIVHPTARPADLPDRLRRHGLVEAEVVAGMSMPIAGLPPPEPCPADVEIVEVSGPADVAGLLELIAWRWQVAPDLTSVLREVTGAFDVVAPPAGEPPVRLRSWIARQRGVPVAKTVLHLADGVAGIYGVATKPAARGLGLARRLTVDALTFARREGYERAVLHATPAAQSLYAKLGFRSYAPFRVFAPPDTLHL